MRVWPGPEGRELFCLQLRGLLKKRIQDPESEITFFVEAVGLPGCPTPLLRLPGLASYGVASYCAAIGEALATLSTTCTTSAAADLSQFSAVGQPSAPTDTDPTTASGPGGGGGGSDGGDDWIELLCSVADLLEGGTAEEGMDEVGGWRQRQQQQQLLLPPQLPPPPPALCSRPSSVRVWAHICWQGAAWDIGTAEGGYGEEEQQV